MSGSNQVVECSSPFCGNEFLIKAENGICPECGTRHDSVTEATDEQSDKAENINGSSDEAAPVAAASEPDQTGIELSDTGQSGQGNASSSTNDTGTSASDASPPDNSSVGDTHDSYASGETTSSDDTVEGTEQPEESVESAIKGEEEEDDSTTNEIMCPECGESNEAGHQFCYGCGTELPDEEEDEDELTECPDCGEDLTELDAPLFCPNCGNNLSDDGQDGADTEASESGQPSTTASGEDTDQEPISSVTLEVMGESLDAALNDPVGRRIRRVLIQAGRDRDDARRIHREHVQFETENGTPQVRVLGELGIEHGQTEYGMGETVEIDDGDIINFNDVVEATVQTNRQA